MVDNQEKKIIQYDLVIIGGGLVGTGLLLALQHAGLRIALVDASAIHREDNRLFALNDSSCQFLANIGVWPLLMNEAEPIHAVQVSYAGRFGRVSLQREELKLSSLGHVVPAQVIETAMQASLQEMLLSNSRIVVYRPAVLQQLSQVGDTINATIASEDGQLFHLQTPLLIGADGTESTVRKQREIEAELIDYAQSAIVTRTILKRPHQQIAYERFCDRSAIAMLPLRDNTVATIWSGDHALMTSLAALSDKQFLEALQSQFGYRLGRLQHIAERYQFPLKMLRAKKIVDGGVLLMGNAAHTLHPIAAQGFNLAIFEVALFAESLLNKIKKGDTFTYADLAGLAAKMEHHQSHILEMSHKLAVFFGKKSWKHVAVSAGMVGFDMLPPLKRKFMSAMLGRAGAVPSLLLSNSG
ncbi:MAG TPA: FAD-dependent monooxygenase [Gammaproteobacteria bacterium]|jgi:2-octaprenyl-6-methoxyphenol hydroxylase|nr:FAD-dependent monooxygenase [Gammaproteobacteria bacterium]